MEHVSFTVETPDRLDVCIASAFSCSRTQANALIRQRAVRVNGVIAGKPARRLRAGDQITVTQPLPPEEKSAKLPPGDVRLFTVLYEDPSCLVIDKPAGIAVHPGSGTGHEETLIGQIRMQYGNSFHLAHRLDKGTTGCLLIAKSAEDLDHLQRQFQDRSVRKTYLAIVAGSPAHVQAVIDAHIGRSLKDRTKMSLFRTANSRSAITRYKILGENAAATISLLQCELQTGRTHQIRVHLSGIGHPIIGDTAYGTEKEQQLAASLDVMRPQLHSWHLEFVSPATGNPVHVTAPVPEDMLDVLIPSGLSVPNMSW